MAIEQKVRDQLQALADEGFALANRRYDQAHPGYQGECLAWSVSAEHLVSVICPLPENPFRLTFGECARQTRASGPWGFENILQLAILLKRLSVDADNGLIASVAVAASAETLDDLLDQANEYRRRGHKEGSGILATAVYEDTVRRIARANAITEAKMLTDTLISELVRGNIISSLVAKRCRFASGVRNHALHAQWAEFSLADVEDVLRLTKQLLDDHLAP